MCVLMRAGPLRKFFFFMLIDLENGVSLRTQVCRALSGYQRLCPNIFLQINFNPAKLLPSPRATRGGEGCLPRKQELEAVMELVENYGVDSRSLVILYCLSGLAIYEGGLFGLCGCGHRARSCRRVSWGCCWLCLVDRLMNCLMIRQMGRLVDLPGWMLLVG